VAISIKDSQALADLADILYDFLPGSGNARLAFPIAAEQVGVEKYWAPGSKRSFCPLIEAVVRQSLTWRRRKSEPLRRDEIDALNAVLLRLGFKIPDLYDPNFLRGLARAIKPGPAENTPDVALIAELQSKLLDLAKLSPTSRGLGFEHFLTEMFVAFRLAIRPSIGP